MISKNPVGIDAGIYNLYILRKDIVYHFKTHVLSVVKDTLGFLRCLIFQYFVRHNKFAYVMKKRGKNNSFFLRVR